MMVVVGDDLGDNGGSRWWMTAGDKVGDNMGDDISDKDGRIDGG